MNINELQRASIQCTHNELRILLYLSAYAVVDPNGFETSLNGKVYKLELGQVHPSRISIIRRELRIERYKMKRVLHSLVTKAFILLQSYPCGNGNGKGFSIVTSGLTTGISLSIPEELELFPDYVGMGS